jgi:hypothetical protein
VFPIERTIEISKNNFKKNKEKQIIQKNILKKKTNIPNSKSVIHA